MKPTKIFLVFSGIIIISFFQCEMDKPNLPGDISGKVTDAETSQPLDSVTVGLNQANSIVSTTSTDSEGSYSLKKIEPGFYEITASKPRYAKVGHGMEVKPAELNNNDMVLSLAPWPEISVSFLDFGMESITQSFTIQNVGSGTLNYHCLSSLDWVEFDHPIGDVSTETDTIKVTINRSVLTEDTYKELIRIFSLSDEEDVIDTVNIYLNGLIDKDGNYYKIVTIGTQTWMGENLNTGTVKHFEGGLILSNNGEIEKYCYDNDEANCDTYGALYSWNEAMDYVSDDQGIWNPQAGSYYDFINIQGICPDGWHIPTWDEWETLLVFVGKAEGGERLKADSPLWEGDTGGTDEFDFSVLPGGALLQEPELSLDFYRKGIRALTWKATLNETFIIGQVVRILDNTPEVYWGPLDRDYAAAVRCIKNPE